LTRHEAPMMALREGMTPQVPSLLREIGEAGLRAEPMTGRSIRVAGSQYLPVA
jgi:hypothetical protein